MNIVILGSGNIATHFAVGFHKLGHTILQVYSRNKANANALASLFSANATDTLTNIDKEASLYLLAVSDGAIGSVAEQLPSTLTGTVIHCSGATDMTILSRFASYGVIYPVQSLSKDVETDVHHIPFGIQGSNERISEHLFDLMKSLSPKTFYCDSKQRLALHTAAVFANNFTNTLFQISYDILKEQNLSFELLTPIILETAIKVQNRLPSQVQTGPAQRNDIPTIEKHLQFLSKNPNWLKIYQQLTEEIRSRSSF